MPRTVPAVATSGTSVVRAAAQKAGVGDSVSSRAGRPGCAQDLRRLQEQHQSCRDRRRGWLSHFR